LKLGDGTSLFLAVFALLTVVVSSVASGKIAGANYTAGFAIPGLNFTWLQRGLQSGNTNASSGAGQSETNISTSSAHVGITPVSSDFLFPPIDVALSLPGWLLLTAAVGFLSISVILILRLKTGILTIDLNRTIREMEEQQKRLSNSWSYRLRNRALLRYYTLLVRACTKIGLKEIPTETPMEYIQRASSFLNVDGKEASRFAAAVNRCRYGEELSTDDAAAASVLMGQFTRVIRSKTLVI
jgi:hypothetical protein